MTQTQLTALVVEPTVPADRSAEFVPVTGGGESASAGGLLISAYILMWFFVFGLIWLSIKKLSGLTGRVDELEKKLAAHDSATQNGSAS